MDGQGFIPLWKEMEANAASGFEKEVRRMAFELLRRIFVGLVALK
jgi:hypothetical protein